MAQINVSNLTFAYEGSFDTIFENVSFSIDTNWKIGFIGRNGKGKTTFLNLLLGKYDYSGTITTGTVFDYFPYPLEEGEWEKCAAELMDASTSRPITLTGKRGRRSKTISPGKKDFSSSLTTATFWTRASTTCSS